MGIVNKAVRYFCIVHLNLGKRAFWTIWVKLKAFLLGVKVGRSISCYGNVHLIPGIGSKIVIGDHVQLVSDTKRCSASSLYAPVRIRTFERNACVFIGNQVSLNGTSITCRSRTIKIGDGTLIGPNVVITDSDFHSVGISEDRLNDPGFDNDKDVIIGKNVWIGMQSLILKGVNIGDHAIIGARSVVTRDVPSGVVVAGNPAREIRQLFPKTMECVI
jgi:acetyltransferase-like isoleucine patch superfamily enzyme